MRYEARWSNGFWKTFDHERFADIDTHATKTIAEEKVQALNAVRRK